MQDKKRVSLCSEELKFEGSSTKFFHGSFRDDTLQLSLLMYSSLFIHAPARLFASCTDENDFRSGDGLGKL
jgi:hypothetical protein